MLLYAAEAIRRTLRDVRDLCELYKLVLAATATGVIVIAVLLMFGLGAFLLAASCMSVAACFGGLAGYDLGRSSHAASLMRAERETERLRQELDAQTAANAGLRHLAEKYKTSADLSSELAESHLAEVHRLRGKASHG